MNIVHVIRTLDPEFGGPPVVCARLACAQAARGHFVTILAGDDGPTQAASPGVPVWPVSAPPLAELVIRGTVRRRLAEKLARASVLHLHGVWDPILLAAGAEALRAGVPYVVMPHGMLDPWSLSQKKWKKRLAMALGVRRFLDRASAIHVLNPLEGDLLQPLELATRTRVIPNGVELAELDSPPNPAEFRTSYPTLGDAPYVLFLGRLHFKKGLDILATAFATIARSMPAIRLVVAGPDGGSQGQFEQQIQDLGLVDRVILTGPLYGSLKWAALMGADCFCLPSRQEGFSVAILEALACRVPVVISENCHFPEVGEVGAGVVVPLSDEGVANGLIRVLANSILADEMGKTGRQLVADHYTWDHVAKSSETLYGELINKTNFPAVLPQIHSVT